MAGAARLALAVRGRVSLSALTRLGLAPIALGGTARVQGDVGGTAASPTVAVRLAVPSLKVDAVEARKVEGRLGWDGAVLAVPAGRHHRFRGPGSGLSQRAGRAGPERPWEVPEGEVLEEVPAEVREELKKEVASCAS